MCISNSLAGVNVPVKDCRQFDDWIAVRRVQCEWRNFRFPFFCFISMCLQFRYYTRYLRGDVLSEIVEPRDANPMRVWIICHFYPFRWWNSIASIHVENDVFRVSVVVIRSWSGCALHWKKNSKKKRKKKLKRVMMISPSVGGVRDAIDIYQHLFSHRISFTRKRTWFHSPSNRTLFWTSSRNSFPTAHDDTVYNFQLTMTSEIGVEHARTHSKELFCGNEKLGIGIERLKKIVSSFVLCNCWALVSSHECIIFQKLIELRSYLSSASG